MARGCDFGNAHLLSDASNEFLLAMREYTQVFIYCFYFCFPDYPSPSTKDLNDISDVIWPNSQPVEANEVLNGAACKNFNDIRQGLTDLGFIPSNLEVFLTSFIRVFGHCVCEYKDRRGKQISGCDSPIVDRVIQDFLKILGTNSSSARALNTDFHNALKVFLSRSEQTNTPLTNQGVVPFF